VPPDISLTDPSFGAEGAASGDAGVAGKAQSLSESKLPLATDKSIATGAQRQRADRIFRKMIDELDDSVGKGLKSVTSHEIDDDWPRPLEGDFRRLKKAADQVMSLYAVHGRIDSREVVELAMDVRCIFSALSGDSANSAPAQDLNRLESSIANISLRSVRVPVQGEGNSSDAGISAVLRTSPASTDSPTTVPRARISSGIHFESSTIDPSHLPYDFAGIQPASSTRPGHAASVNDMPKPALTNQVAPVFVSLMPADAGKPALSPPAVSHPAISRPIIRDALSALPLIGPDQEHAVPFSTFVPIQASGPHAINPPTAALLAVDQDKPIQGGPPIPQKAELATDLKAQTVPAGLEAYLPTPQFSFLNLDDEQLTVLKDLIALCAPTAGITGIVAQAVPATSPSTPVVSSIKGNTSSIRPLESGAVAEPDGAGLHESDLPFLFDSGLASALVAAMATTTATAGAMNVLNQVGILDRVNTLSGLDVPLKLILQGKDAYLISGGTELDLMPAAVNPLVAVRSMPGAQGPGSVANPIRMQGAGPVAAFPAVPDSSSNAMMAADYSFVVPAPGPLSARPDMTGTMTGEVAVRVLTQSEVPSPPLSQSADIPESAGRTATPEEWEQFMQHYMSQLQSTQPPSLRPEGIARIPVAELTALASAQRLRLVQELSPEQVASLTSKQLAILQPEELQLFKPKQLALLKPEQTYEMDGSQLLGLAKTLWTFFQTKDKEGQAQPQGTSPMMGAIKPIQSLAASGQASPHIASEEDPYRERYHDQEVTLSPMKVRELVRDILFALLELLFNRKDGAQQDSSSRPRMRIAYPDASLSRPKLVKASSSTDQTASRNESTSTDYARPVSAIIQPAGVLSTQAAVVPGAVAQVQISKIMQANAPQSSDSVAQEDGMVVDTGIRTLKSRSESDSGSESDSNDGQGKSGDDVQSDGDSNTKE
jgi:hypothetical protein